MTKTLEKNYCKYCGREIASWQFCCKYCYSDFEEDYSDYDSNDSYEDDDFDEEYED